MNLAKIDLSTGEMRVLHSQPQPANGSALITAGGRFSPDEVRARLSRELEHAGVQL